MMTFLAAVGLAVIFVVAGLFVKSRYVSFWAQDPADYAGGPAFDMRERFNGPIECEGVIYGPTGRVTSRFVANFDAKWEGNIGTVTERFRYDSGNVQDRQWIFTLGNDGSIKAEAGDLVGAGTGQQNGSAVNLNYDIKLTDDAGGHVLRVNDWMYLMENGTIMNRSQFRKFGIKVAELVATMRPANAA